MNESFSREEEGQDDDSIPPPNQPGKRSKLARRQREEAMALQSVGAHGLASP
jgi:hypothetical protein